MYFNLRFIYRLLTKTVEITLNGREIKNNVKKKKICKKYVNYVKIVIFFFLLTQILRVPLHGSFKCSKNAECRIFQRLKIVLNIDGRKNRYGTLDIREGDNIFRGVRVRVFFRF